MHRAGRSIALVAMLVSLAASCAPRARPLAGVPAPARLPRGELAAGHRRIVFRWDFEDPSLGARGEGVARVAPPDSVRIDLFLSGGLGSGHVIVLGDSVFVPGDQSVKRYLPPPALLWAALGRLAVPASPDTTARQDGDILRADIGRDPTWRASFEGGRLTRLERIQGERLVEFVSRADSMDVRWENRSSRRALTLKISRTEGETALDPTIWRH